MAYVAASPASENTQLFLWTMDQFEARAIPGTEGAVDPFFSPDSQWIGFVSGRELKKVSVNGGPPSTVCVVTGPPIYGHLGWGPSGMIVFGQLNTGLWRVAASGGEPQPLTTLDHEAGETGNSDPYFLPGSNTLLFTKSTSGLREVWSLSLDTGEQKELVEGSRGRYVLSGILIVQQDDSLVAMPFDVEQLEVTGPGFVLSLQVRIQPAGMADFSFSDTGTLAYLPTTGQDRSSRLILVDRQGEVKTLKESESQFEEPRFSPDGQQIAVTVQSGTSHQIWTYEMERGILSPVTVEHDNRSAVWTPDGKQLIFMSDRTGSFSIFSMPSDGSGEADRIGTMTGTWVVPTSLSQDGVLAYETGPAQNRDIWVLALENDGEPTEFQSAQFHEGEASFSPDGKWVAFTSKRSGQAEVYVKSYPGEGGVVRISVDGGGSPVWGHTGKELFYWHEDQIMGVSVLTEPNFKAELPEVAIQGPYHTVVLGTEIRNYDVDPEDQSFVVVGTGQETDLTQINVVLNWFEELKRLVPTN